MKKIITALVLGFTFTGLLGACSFLPTFSESEPQLGAALSGYSGGNYSSADGTSLMVDGVLFDFEKASLQPEANALVSRAVKYLRLNPGSQVIVEGHTDHLGAKSYNQRLSEKRAGAIAKALKAKGISSDRITTVGYGESKPVADNRTEDGRRANRRVEIILQNEY